MRICSCCRVRTTAGPTADKCKVCYREIAARPLPPMLVPFEWGARRFWVPIDQSERSRISHPARVPGHVAR